MNSLTSVEADQYEGVKELVEAFDPWPLQVEKAWYIAREHLSDAHLRGEALATRVYRREAMEHWDLYKKADRVVQTLMERHEKVLRYIESMENTPYDAEDAWQIDTIRGLLKGEE